MGGRGQASNKNKANKKILAMSGGVITNATPKIITTTYHEQHGYQKAYFNNTVLEATSDSDGNVIFSYAKGTYDKQAKTNKTSTVTYNIVAGAVDGKTFNINWDKVKSISGQTYDVMKEAKSHGFKWDNADKKWIKPL